MSNSRAAWGGIVLGALAVAAIPVAAVVSKYFDRVELVRATIVAVAAALVLGLAALSLARRARYRVERSVLPSGRRAARLARVFAWAGLYAGWTGALALAVYGVLRYMGD